jgi:carboxyl-terminal processing protease
VREVLCRLAGAASLAVGLPAFAALEPVPPPVQMEAKQPEISRNVTKLIEELHYSRPQIDNSYSSAILDRYLDALDGNRMYFLESDVASFGRYRYEMDDRAKNGDLQPVFDIFNLFRQRTRERVEHALELLQSEPDFTLDESFVFDRSEMPWPVSQEEINDVWREKVKSDALSLMLTGKTWPEAAKVLTDRYENLYKRMTQLTSDDVFETFMNALAHTMDPHSSYLSPRQSEEYRIQMSLSYDGIGASLQPEDDYVKVVEVIPGGPAQIDGQLKPEDRITAVGEGKNGELVDVIGWRLDDVVQLIRGPGGTTVRLQVLPAGAAPGSPQKLIALVRDKVKLEEQAAKSQIKEVDYQGHKYKIGVIDVPSFYQDFAARSRGDQDYTSTSKDVARLIRQLQSQGIDGLLMDLRENGGGHLSEATELSGLFIDRGPVVQLRERRGEPQVLDDPNPGIVYDGPMAVLVDRYSASASEIFAGAIQDYKRGLIIGQQTFGKGSVQNLFSLDRVMRGDNNGQLTLTIGKYYRITGESTQHRGVLPDIELPSLVDTKTVGESTRDTALPWDRIKPTQFKPFQKIDGEIQTIQADEQQRTHTDPELEYLLGDISALNKINSEKSVSLNLAKRQAEREELQDDQLARENARRAALGLQPLAGVADLDKAEAPEQILLNEATRIVAEMVADGRLSGGKRQQLLTGGNSGDSTASARQPAAQGIGH